MPRRSGINLEMVNTVLLVIILILVISCCLRNNNEGFNNNNNCMTECNQFENNVDKYMNCMQACSGASNNQPQNTYKPPSNGVNNGVNNLVAQAGTATNEQENDCFATCSQIQSNNDRRNCMDNCN